MSPRHAAAAGALIAALSAPALPGHAQDRPSPLAGQTVTIVEPFGPGSLTETVLRLLKPGMEKALGATIAIHTERSPDGSLAFDRVYKAAPDGRTLLATMDAVQVFYEVIAVPTQRAYPMTAVAKLTDGVSMALVAANDSPIRDIATLVAQLKAKRRPKLALYGAASPAGVFAALVEGHVDERFGERFDQTDSEIKESLRTRRAEIAVLPTPAIFDDAGKPTRLRPLVTSGGKRHPQLPDVPTLGEVTGKTKHSFTAAVGLLAPPRTPDALALAFYRAAQAAAADPAVKAVADKADVPLAVNGPVVLRESLSRMLRVTRDILLVP